MTCKKTEIIHVHGLQAAARPHFLTGQGGNADIEELHQADKVTLLQAYNNNMQKTRIWRGYQREANKSL